MIHPEFMRARCITVGYFIARLRWRKPERIPKINFQGYYLRALGFECGDTVEIIPEGLGKIVIQRKANALPEYLGNSAGNQPIAN